ncbi:Ankyrin repeat protein [Aspergillus sclerotialis]|uniref:Ankyrin repeat protein n=1 Tax=Aspergillus sclerotialis TaxID=2070753 RepID=A0A3A2ZUL4_9EURO|nr:Ankyrin repeat protein [Aspergillus sclerotialis]
MALLTTRIAKHRRDSQRRGWLHRAAESGDLYMVRTLVNAGAKTNWNWSGFPIASPVYLAGKEGQPKVIELILSLQSDLIKFITSVDPSVLHACAYTGDLKLVMKILRAFKYPRRLCGHPSFRPRFYVPYEGVALIHAAAYGGNPCIIRQFAKRQVDLFALTRCRMTALHVAALKGHCHAIKLLVYYKVPIEAVDRLGRTAWSLAMGCGHFEAAQLLVKLGAKENVGYHNVSFSWDNLAGG